jgi:hypothetical protein
VIDFVPFVKTIKLKKDLKQDVKENLKKDISLITSNMSLTQGKDGMDFGSFLTN